MYASTTGFLAWFTKIFPLLRAIEIRKLHGFLDAIDVFSMTACENKAYKASENSSLAAACLKN